MKIMVCYNGTNVAKKALELALRYSKGFDATIYAVTALDGDPKKQLDDLEKAEKILEYANNFLTIDGVKTETKLLPANNLSVAENINTFAEMELIDKIIIGVEKKSKVGKFFFGSTAQDIILLAPCPVVIAK